MATRSIVAEVRGWHAYDLEDDPGELRTRRARLVNIAEWTRWVARDRVCRALWRFTARLSRRIDPERIYYVNGRTGRIDVES